MKCYHPCGCEEDPCPRHGPRCTNPPLPQGLCAEHGCRRCGGVILADTEDWERPVCYDCFHELGEPTTDPSVLLDDQAYMYSEVPGRRVHGVVLYRDGTIEDIYDMDDFIHHFGGLKEDHVIRKLELVSDPPGGVIIEEVDVKFERAIPSAISKLMHVEPADELPEPYNGPWPPVEQF